MPRPERIKYIKAVEAARKSRVLVAFFGDRGNLETRVAPDVVPLVARHLRNIGKQPRIDLFLYTLGGDVLAGYRIVSLLREYCTERFSVIVPFRCQSTGTLVALGADEIFMLPEGQLSPVDPSINGPYNPPVPGITMPAGAGPGPTLPVSVEEVVSYFSLARELGGLKGEEALVEAFQRLTENVRPIALGQVYRARTQIRMLSRKLLQTHMKSDDPLIDSLVETLTEKLYSHDYIITRREAQAMGLKVTDPDQALDDAAIKLYEEYEKDLELRSPYNPMGQLTKQMAKAQPGAGPPKVNFSADRAILESIGRCDVYHTEQVLSIQNQNLQAQVIEDGWKTL